MHLQLCWSLFLGLLVLLPSLAPIIGADLRSASSFGPAAAELLSQLVLDRVNVTANSTVSNSSSTTRIQSFVSAIVLATLTQHNDSSAGALPPIQSINELLRQAQGSEAFPFQIEEQANATVDTPRTGASKAATAATEFSSNGAAAAAGQADPSLSFGYFTQSAPAAPIPPAPSGAPTPPPPSFTAPVFAAADPVLSPNGAGAAPAPADVALEAALRAIRWDVSQIVYSLLRASSFQLTSVAFWILLAQGPNATMLSNVLRAVANQLGAIAYYVQAERFEEVTEAAIEHLQRILSDRQRAQTNEGTNAQGSQTQPSPPSSPSSSGFLASLLACPSFLYGSWIRLETGSSSPPSTAERVVLRFAADGMDRLEVFSDESRQRAVQHQRWSGSMRVKCFWSEAQQAEAAAAMQTRGDPTAAPPASLLHSLQTALSLSTSSSARIVVELMQPATAATAVAGGAWSDVAPAASMQFTFLSLPFDGARTAVLVERLADGGAEAPLKYGHAFVRTGEQL